MRRRRSPESQNYRWRRKPDARVTPSPPAGVTVLICTLNEAENLPHILPRIPDWVDEVLIIDGHSTDGTREVAARVCPRARILLQPSHGKGDALRYGIRQARGEIILTLDADGQTDPQEMAFFVGPLQEGYDFAKGTRFRRPFSRSRPLHRILGNWLITLTFDLMFLRPYTDLCSGYNAFRKQAILTLDLTSPNGLADEPLLHARACKAGLRIIEIPHHDPPRIAGMSKAPSWRQGVMALRTVVAERLRGR